jgi:hypothetical protein
MPVAKKAHIQTLTSILKGKTLKQQFDQPEYNFYDRRKFIKKVISIISSNYNHHGNPDHKVHSMMLVSGGSGIGKSRSGWELQNLVTHAENYGFDFNVPQAKLNLFREALQNPCYLYLNLNYEYNYIKEFDEIMILMYE